MAPSSDSKAARSVIIVLSLIVSVLAIALVYLTPRQPSSGEPSVLANLNALLNGAAGLSLLLGYFFIRHKSVARHRACMLVAFAISVLFLITYLLHHGQVGSVPFRGEGPIRVVYFSILIPHIVLAAAVLPLSLLTLYRGWTQRIAAHRKVARVTLPIWLFVSFSGVAVYWLLYYGA